MRQRKSTVKVQIGLRASSELRHSYEQAKRAILAIGITDSHEYCKAKGAFITEALGQLQSASLPQGNTNERRDLS